VRVPAAQALLGAPAGAAGDEPLAQALSDESPLVRGRAVDVLGARGAKSHAHDVSARLDDEAESLDVRARAALALGQMCDMASIDHLTELAQAAVGDGSNPTSRVIAASAAEALGRLAPPDLARRLAPLTDAKAPRVAQEIGKSALSVTELCPKAVQ
jgi:HEAT repeat protein